MTVKLTAKRVTSLREKFEQLYTLHHRPEFLDGDPLLFAHRFQRPDDQELVALLAAIFASGNIKSIQAFLRALLERLSDQPAQLVRDRKPAKWRGVFDGIGHRWVRSADLEVLFALLGETLRREESLGRLFSRLDNPDSLSIQETHTAFVDTILSQPIEPLVSRERIVERQDGRTTNLASIQSILLTSPRGGSACKRMNLFFRWVVRPADGIDLGLWTDRVSPSRLLMPVDVHVLRFAQQHRLTKRKVPDRKAMEEITNVMRQLNPSDPLRYDFAIVRAGVQGLAEK